MKLYTYEDIIEDLNMEIVRVDENQDGEGLPDSIILKRDNLYRKYKMEWEQTDN